jgi:hypothetical protein
MKTQQQGVDEMKVTVTITREYDGEFDELIEDGRENKLGKDLINEGIIDTVCEDTAELFHGADWKIKISRDTK